MTKLLHRFRIDQSHFAVVVRRPVTILVATLTVALFGAVSYQRLPLALMPEMNYPTLTVRTTFPGTAPEEMEALIARPLEQQLGITPKLIAITSISKAGQTDVVLEFQWKTDMDLVAGDVREKIDRLRPPEGAQRPLLLHYDPAQDPILRFSLGGPQSLYELRRFAEEDIRLRVEALPGVAAVQVKGGFQEQYLVAVDEAKLTALRLDIGQVGARLQQVNINLPGGDIRDGRTEYLVRTLNEFRSIDDIRGVIVARQGGVDIRLGDIAEVSRFHEELKVITRTNGQDSVEIEIYKEADANVLTVAAAVRDAMLGSAEQRAFAANPRPNATTVDNQELRRTTAHAEMERRRLTDYLAYRLPPGAALELLSDQSVFIQNAIDEVKENAIAGGLIAVIVLFLFLRNATQTLIVSACIPVSILATFAPMYMANVSLNIISLGGLALGVGNLVDNAIVVLESIYRCHEEGDDPLVAVVRGTSEVAGPVIASTLTTVAVFFPIVFMEGVASQVFGDMALTVVFSQIASLIAGLYLIPMLAAKAAELSRDRHRAGRKGHLLRRLLRGPLALWTSSVQTALGWFEATTTWLQRKYPPILEAALRARFAVVGSAVAIFVVTAIFVVPRLGRDLIPVVHQGEFHLNLTLPVGTAIARTSDVAEMVDEVVRSMPEVERTAVIVGAEESASASIDAGDHTARVTVKMKPGQGARAEVDLIDRIRGEFADVPELKLEVSFPVLFSLKSPVEVRIRGYDLATLKRVSREVEAVLAAEVPGLADVRAMLQAGHPEIQLVYDRDRLAEYGLSLRSVAEIVRNKVQGRIATQIRHGDRFVDVFVRLREDDRSGIEELRNIVVNPGAAVPIPLSAVADLTIEEGPTEIRRIDQQRTAVINANVHGADLASVSANIIKALDAIRFPPGFSYELGGQHTEMKSSLNTLLLAFALAVFLVYIVMASQFESLVQPFLIMMTVPLAVIGVVWVLWIAEIPVTIMVFLGLIILVGIVVNNAIVLVDYINTLRARGVEKRPAIVEAGRARLRPILMTAATTVVGLVPMALGFGEGAEIRTPMAITVIVGLSSATVLTLIVMPILYYQFTSDEPVSAAINGSAEDYAGEPLAR